MGPSLSAMYVMYCCYCHVPCCCLATMLCAGLVDSVCHVLLLLSGDHASCGSCRQCMSCTIVTVWRPCFVRVLSTVYVMYYCCCLVCGSCRQCMSCTIVTVWRPCFVRVLSTVYVMYYCCCLVCGYCRQCMSCTIVTVWRPRFVRVLSTVYVMYYCCCLATMLCAGLVDSVCRVLLLLSGDHASCGSCRQCMSCTIVAVWQPYFVRVLSTVYVVYYCYCLATMLRAGLVDSVCHVLLLLSGDHASCGSCRQCMSCTIVTVWRPCFVRVLSTVYVVYYCYCLATMLRVGLVDSVCHVLLLLSVVRSC